MSGFSWDEYRTGPDGVTEVVRRELPEAPRKRVVADLQSMARDLLRLGG